VGGLTAQDVAKDLHKADLDLFDHHCWFFSRLVDAKGSKIEDSLQQAAGLALAFAVQGYNPDDPTNSFGDDPHFYTSTGTTHPKGSSARPY
jgi:hypothetical protein